MCATATPCSGGTPSSSFGDNFPFHWSLISHNVPLLGTVVTISNAGYLVFARLVPPPPPAARLFYGQPGARALRLVHRHAPAASTFGLLYYLALRQSPYVSSQRERLFLSFWLCRLAFDFSGVLSRNPSRRRTLPPDRPLFEFFRTDLSSQP